MQKLCANFRAILWSQFRSGLSASLILSQLCGGGCAQEHHSCFIIVQERTAFRRGNAAMAQRLIKQAEELLAVDQGIQRCRCG